MKYDLFSDSGRKATGLKLGWKKAVVFVFYQNSTKVYRDRDTLTDGQTNSTLLHSTTKANGPVRLLIRVLYTSLLI